jgi:hypothetical protein
MKAQPHAVGGIFWLERRCGDAPATNWVGKGLTMANLINKILEDKDEKTKQQLELLLLSARSKLQQFKMAINEGYLNPEAQQKLEVIGRRSIEWGEEYRVNISSGVDKAIDDILTNFFHGTDESLKTGFKTMINVAIKTILGDASAGEIESRSWMIVPEYNAFIKVDLRIWRYNFTSTGIVSDVQDAFCFVFSKAVVDHTTLSIDELIYFVSKMFGTSLNLPSTKTYIDQMKALWRSMSDQPPQQVLADYYSARKAARATRR